MRGGIVDLFPPRYDEPLRIDFFGDEVDGIRTFDVASQRTTARLEACTLLPISEVLLDDETIKRFRIGYRSLAARERRGRSDVRGGLGGQRYQGLEHWLPLFYERLQTIFDYLPDAPVILDQQAEEASDRRLAMIDEYYAARRELGAGRFADAAVAYNPVPIDRLFLDGDGWEAALARRAVGVLSPFLAPPEADAVDRCRRPASASTSPKRAGAPTSTSSTRSRGASPSTTQPASGSLIAAVSRGSRDRLATVLREHKIADVRPGARAGREARKLDKRAIALAVLALDRGFVTRRSRGDRRAGHPRRPHGAARRPPGAPRELPDRGVVAVAGRSRRPHRPRHRPLRRRWRRCRSTARRTIACASSTPTATACTCRSRTSR